MPDLAMPSALFRAISSQFWQGCMSHEIYVFAIYFHRIYLIRAIARPASTNVKSYIYYQRAIFLPKYHLEAIYRGEKTMTKVVAGLDGISRQGLFW
tara:strand:+ start:494 stop:781 length:288 start_codon:yes stop_codon:yes gene_type:complete